MSSSIKVCDGIYQVGGGSLSRGEDCSVYLIENRAEGALIDMGAGASAQRIVENIESTGFDISQMRYLIVTHGHIDHIGGLAYMKKAMPQAQVLAHRLELEAIRDGSPNLTGAAWYGVDYTPVNVDIVIDENQSLKLGSLSINCLHTPGHTRGGLSMYVDVGRIRVLFGQDIHGPFSKDWGSNMSDWRKSMKSLLALKADILCEGHYGNILPAARVKSYIEYYMNQHRA